jgi:hypothetical protein
MNEYHCDQCQTYFPVGLSHQTNSNRATYVVKWKCKNWYWYSCDRCYNHEKKFGIEDEKIFIPIGQFQRLEEHYHVYSGKFIYEEMKSVKRHENSKMI